jgi:hypothetical protein
MFDEAAGVIFFHIFQGFQKGFIFRGVAFFLRITLAVLPQVLTKCNYHGKRGTFCDIS